MSEPQTFTIVVSIPDGEASHDVHTVTVPASISAGHVGLVSGYQITFSYRDIPDIIEALHGAYVDPPNQRTYRWAMEYFARQEANS